MLNWHPWSILTYYLRIYLEGIRKTSKILNEDMRPTSRELNPVPFEYKALTYLPSEAIHVSVDWPHASHPLVFITGRRRSDVCPLWFPLSVVHILIDCPFLQETRDIYHLYGTIREMLQDNRVFTNQDLAFLTTSRCTRQFRLCHIQYQDPLHPGNLVSFFYHCAYFKLLNPVMFLFVTC
jgi:hypothetical protein